MDIDKLDLSELVVLEEADYKQNSWEGEYVQLTASLKSNQAVRATITIYQKPTRDLADTKGQRFMPPSIVASVEWERLMKMDQALVKIELLRLAYKIAALMDVRSASVLEEYPFPDPMITEMLKRMKPEESVKL